MNPVQYIILDPSLKMSTGKAAAQAAHASQLGLLTHGRDPYAHSIVNRWMMGGHYAKVVLQTTNLQVVERYLNDRGFKTALIIDEGRTELDGLTPTAIGTGVVDKDDNHTRATFGEFKLYGDEPRHVAPATPEIDRFQATFLPYDKDEAQSFVRKLFRQTREKNGEAHLDE